MVCPVALTYYCWHWITFTFFPLYKATSMSRKNLDIRTGIFSRILWFLSLQWHVFLKHYFCFLFKFISAARILTRNHKIMGNNDNYICSSWLASSMIRNISLLLWQTLYLKETACLLVYDWNTVCNKYIII